MEFTLREAWTNVVLAEDYELHMANVGQAEANAELVRNAILDLPLNQGARLLFAGAGPGQMFDYLDGAFLALFEVVFTDINPAFLTRISERAIAAGLVNVSTQVDDVEDPKIKGPFDLAILVLVLEHVDWKKALSRLSQLPAQAFLLVTQKNPPEIQSNVSPNRVLPGSLALASMGEKPHLIDACELGDFMTDLRFRLRSSETRLVADGKEMMALTFDRIRSKPEIEHPRATL